MWTLGYWHLLHQFSFSRLFSSWTVHIVLHNENYHFWIEYGWYFQPVLTAMNAENGQTESEKDFDN